MSPITTLFSFEGLMFVLRFFHIFAGIVWIGTLYYFNFMQTPFFAEAEAPTRSGMVQKLVPRALWWFRWGAFWTALLGLVILGARGHQMGEAYFMSSRGINILTGGILGLIMAANVWFVIWPAQKVVIQNAIDTAAGKPANPEAAARGARAGVASRTNVLLSIPMLFFMVGAVHLPYAVSETSNLTAYWVVTALAAAAIEGNALKGKLGPLATVKGVITCGFVLIIVHVGLMALFL
ncbi:MAG: urate hydroxylase PuuD [Bdellovibrionota bacterium]